jgi:methionyl-tRNA formyltransferase
LFWGTPPYAVASLDALVSAGHAVVGVVTQPDRRRGRGNSLQPSAVKSRALELDLPVFTPERIRRDLESQNRLAALNAEISLVVAYGQILPPEVLRHPPLGCWNGHASLLPRWRGAAPIQWALMEGDPETGVGIMAMEEGLDTGPVLLERRLEIPLLENGQQLAERLALLTGQLLIEALPRIEAAGPGAEAERLQRLDVRPQRKDGVTYARMLTKEDAAIDWGESALAIHRRVMGVYPQAGALWRGERLKLLATEPLVPRLADHLSPCGAELARRWGTEGGAQEPLAQPGTVLQVVEGEGVVLATGGRPLLLKQAQLAGKRPSKGQVLIQQLGALPGDLMGAQ